MLRGSGSQAVDQEFLRSGASPLEGTGPGSGDFADTVGGEVLATVVAWAGLTKTGWSAVLGESGDPAAVDVADHGWEFVGGRLRPGLGAPLLMAGGT